MRNVGPAPWIAGYLIAVLSCAAGAKAQAPNGGGAGQGGAGTQAKAQNLVNVGEAHALLLFTRLNKAIGPAEGRANLGAPIPVRGLAGVLVELRYRGMRIGYGQATGAEVLPNQDGVADLAQAGDLALKRAMDVSKLVLSDLALQNYREPIDPVPVAPGAQAPVKPRSRLTLEEALPLVTLDIQVAHTLKPVILGDEAAKSSAFERFVPGYHGLYASASLKGEATRESWVWPGWAMSRNINPKDQMIFLSRQLGLAPEAWDQLGRPRGPVLMTFNCIQVVQPGIVAAGQPKPVPVVLERGNKPSPAGAMTLEQVQRLTDQVASHLSRRVRSKGDLTGDYFPSGNLYLPEVATHEDQAVVALALARYCKRHGPRAGGADVHHTSQSEGAFGQQMAYLESQILLMKKEEGLAIKALFVLAIMDGPGMADKKELRDRLIGEILTHQREDGKWFEKVVDRSGQAQLREMPATLQVIILSAVSRYYQLVKKKGMEPGMAATYGRLVLSMELKNPGTGILPWLGESRARMEGVIAPEPLAALDERLSQMADRLREMQVLNASDDGPTDVVGGLNLGDRNLGGVPDPDWHTGQALHFLANVADNKRIVPENLRARLMLSCSLAARYLGVLAVSGPSTYYMQAPEDALGGIRLVMWNNKLSPGPSAVALLSLLAYQDALDRGEAGVGAGK
jgi:hypothetical protein